MEPNRDRGSDRDFTAAPISAGIVLAESLRNAQFPETARPNTSREDRFTLFWRICGGGVISVGALICITMYQGISNNIAELRTALNHVNETQADFVKKDEFSNRITTIWNGIKESNVANVSVAGLKEREAQLEQQLKGSEDERRELNREVKRLAERLATVEGRQSAARPAKVEQSHERNDEQ